uniref:Uncharacterized protein n=1 Tax=Magallana gigas TaxID=29159 RepID=K1P7B9_MAGGI
MIYAVSSNSNLTAHLDVNSSSRVINQSSGAVDLRSLQQQLNEESLIRLSLVNQLYTLSSDMLTVKQRMMAIAVEGRQFEDKLKAMKKKFIALKNENRRMRDTQEQISVKVSNATDAGTSHASSGSQNEDSVVAFHAFTSKKLNFKTDTTVNVVYDKTSLNTHDVYNTKNGFFTAPSGGLYVFSWTSLVAEMSKFNAELLVNGERKGLAKCDHELGQQGFESCSNTVPVILKTGDLVNIRTVDSLSLLGIQWSSFKGWKVQ